MTEMPGIVITGAAGRMGQMLVRTVLESDKARLVGALLRDGHDWLGRDVGEALGMGPQGVVFTCDPLEALAKAQAVIDFTTPAHTVEIAALAAQARAAHVIGTTGFSQADITKIDAASHHAVVVRAGNMSLGVNLLMSLARRVSSALDEDYDIEIVEAHHRHKVDAPSGTALMLGEAAAEGRGKALADITDKGREERREPRPQGTIGFSVIRGGDIVGEHDVIFAADGERLTLRHVASDRRVFSRGALKAALWGQDKAPGHYSMMDVLGLE
ncbi:MAG: 4-hydroxy-tetrahydrodipicolinate reductase [Mangrovicoccus sp.]